MNIWAWQMTTFSTSLSNRSHRLVTIWEPWRPGWRLRRRRQRRLACVWCRARCWWPMPWCLPWSRPWGCIIWCGWHCWGISRLPRFPRACVRHIHVITYKWQCRLYYKWQKKKILKILIYTENINIFTRTESSSTCVFPCPKRSRRGAGFVVCRRSWVWGQRQGWACNVWLWPRCRPWLGCRHLVRKRRRTATWATSGWWPGWVGQEFEAARFRPRGWIYAVHTQLEGQWEKRWEVGKRIHEQEYMNIDILDIY